jgi:hypothetical protein
MDKNFNINFIIFSPTPGYVDYIGGVIVCHTLANNLTQLGENVYLYADSTKPEYNINLIPWGSEISFDKENTIIIYPSGDGEHTFESYIPSCIKNIPNIVRWLVNNQTTNYPTDNKLYKYAKFFKEFNGQRVSGDLTTLEVDLNLFKNNNLSREGTCFYTKGINPTPPYHNINDLSLDNIYNIPSIQRMEYISKVFNTKEKFICYSNRTFIAILAALCGCTTIVIPTPGVNKKEWSEGFPILKYGIAYGVEDIQWALESKKLVKSEIIKLKQNSIIEAQSFINDCYQWLKNKYDL